MPVDVSTKQIYAVASEDRACARPDGSSMLVRVYRPQGAEPFPAIVHVHGGARIPHAAGRRESGLDSRTGGGVALAGRHSTLHPSG